ncbi:MAG: NADH-quinone oxidoreductase subunit N [Bacteriovoracia bacterium]
MESQIINPLNLSLSKEQLAMLMPYFVISFGAMITLLGGVFSKTKSNLTAMVMCLITLAATLASISKIWGEPAMMLFNNMLAADYYASLFNCIFVIATALVAISSYSYLEKEGIHHFEFYSLLLFSCFGMMLFASSQDLITLFVALEIMSIAVYVLVGFRRTDVRSNEAAVKYFILGSVASAILLYGVALVYGASGSMNLQRIAEFAKNLQQMNAFFVLGATLIVAGFLFKVASVPFHMWMPDVYEGAPTTVTSFMTTGLKAAVFAGLLRVILGLGYSANWETYFNQGIHNVLWVASVATMFVGNIVALTQKNLKRMLAYSSIAHTGYILVGILSLGKSEYAFSAVVLYLVGYVVMNLGAFALISMISQKGDKLTDVEDLAGFGFKYPLLGVAMSIFVFSMAGVPPTVGFIGKYMIFSAAVQAGEIWLSVLAVLCSAISAYYYLRVVVVMYMKEQVKGAPNVEKNFVLSASVVIGLAAIATLHFGVFPNLLIQAAKKAIFNA